MAELAGELERHFTHLKQTGAFDPQREAQRLAWLWQLVEAELLARVREHERVRALLPELERNIREGAKAAALGARQILAAFGPLANRSDP